MPHLRTHESSPDNIPEVNNGSFLYPCMNVSTNANYDYAVNSPLDFQLTFRGPSTYYVQPGLEVAEIIRSTGEKGRVVEVGGPTDDSYELIVTHPLPERPLVTNISANTYHECQTSCVHDGEELGVDIITDSRSLPFRDNSIGLLMASCLPRLDDALLNLSDEEYDAVEYHAFCSLIEGLRGGLYRTEFADIAALSPRIGFWLEASRTVPEGGAVLYKGPVEDELTLAAELGFELVAHTPYYHVAMFNNKRLGDGWREGLSIPHEMLFIKREAAVEDPLPTLIAPILNTELGDV